MMWDHSPCIEFFFPKYKSKITPTDPINAPVNCLGVILSLKITIAMSIVKIGVVLLSIPVSPEEIPVSA